MLLAVERGRSFAFCSSALFSVGITGLWIVDRKDCSTQFYSQHQMLAEDAVNASVGLALHTELSA